MIALVKGLRAKVASAFTVFKTVLQIPEYDSF